MIQNKNAFLEQPNFVTALIVSKKANLFLYKDQLKGFIHYVVHIELTTYSRQSNT
ncbi:hypothetical protein LROSRS0_0289 [Furfurilactobacillus rossiae]|nr:hypothetical protein LROSRS0_0289 [Furfurilactobacillus rossiae]